MHLVRTSCNFRNSMPCQKGKGSLLRTHIFWQCVYFLQLLLHVKRKDVGPLLPKHIFWQCVYFLQLLYHVKWKNGGPSCLRIFLLSPPPHPIIPVFSLSKIVSESMILLCMCCGIWCWEKCSSPVSHIMSSTLQKFCLTISSWMQRTEVQIRLNVQYSWTLSRIWFLVSFLVKSAMCPARPGK